MAFKIEHINDPAASKNHIEIYNSTSSCYAKIDLNVGGRVCKLVFNNNEIISNSDMKNVEQTYASAILFPFVNRIENGKYMFLGNQYQLDKNQREEQHAIHGLVYNKPFKLIHWNANKSSAEISLKYIEDKPPCGFPFKYSLELVYTLTNDSLNLKAMATNIDNKSFPFGVGWHPYFKSEDLYNSFITMESKAICVVNERRIPIHLKRFDFPRTIQIENKEYDDCFVLSSDLINFSTPNYGVNLKVSSANNYLQLYIPKERESIAIEPSTSAPNSFNNAEDVKVLKPNEKVEVSWNISYLEIKTNE